MRVLRSPRPWAVAVALVAATACSDDPAAPSNELTAVEAAELAAILGALAVDQGFSASTSGTASAPAAGPSAVPITFSTSVSFVADCPLGGAVDVDADLAGTLDAETGAVATTMTVVQTHAACVAEGGETGTLFTLDGAPSVIVAMALESNAQSGDFTVGATFDGTVTWASEGRSGTCSMDLDIDTSGNNVTGVGTSTVTGSICGITVNQTSGI